MPYNDSMRTIVILAGGQSRRMGEDKIFLPYRDASFLEHLVKRASDVFDRILISAGSEALVSVGRTVVASSV